MGRQYDIGEPDTPGVIWMRIEGFPDYRVGDNGEVLSRAWGRWRALGGGLNKNGYRKVILYNNRKRRHATIHVLVLEAFAGPRPSGMGAAHGNGIRTDNRLCNLRWATQKENMADKLLHGTSQRGERSGASILKSDQVREIRRRLEAGDRGVDIAKAFGVSSATISAIKVRRLWGHLDAGGRKATNEAAPEVLLINRT